jgi:hypothetical protein
MTVETPGPRNSTRFASEIAELASETAVPVEVVEQLYRAELERLRSNARIVDFVPLLATKSLERLLRERHRTERAHPELTES